MEQENTFEYIQNNEEIIVDNSAKEDPIIENNNDNNNLAEDFVTGLPSWDLEPPYEVIRRVTR